MTRSNGYCSCFASSARNFLSRRIKLLGRHKKFFVTFSWAFMQAKWNIQNSFTSAIFWIISKYLHKYLILHLIKVHVREKCILITSKLINLLKLYAQFRGKIILMIFISYIILINMKTKYISNLNMKFCRAEKARYQVTKKLFLYSFIKYENY